MKYIPGTIYSFEGMIFIVKYPTSKNSHWVWCLTRDFSYDEVNSSDDILITDIFCSEWLDD